MEEVNKVIREINNNPNLTVQEFKITGYASPEGTPPYNMNLSKNRAESFVTYLRNKHSIPAEKIQTDWKGEDWDGLRELVEKSSLNDRNEILEIIANEPDLRRRENKIKQLSGGRTYRTLLNDYYPGLRRNEYMISYASKDFNVREARQLIRTNPEKLRLQDMYMLAHTYPQNSQEFRDVILTAAKYYPEDQTVLVNTAIYNIESGKVDDAIKTLERVNTPEAWNNLGIAYFHKQDYQRAKQYFDMAARAGLERASVNARELSKYLGNSSR
ncbi:MAG: OmpA family protein [Bacteroides sp.]|nr:OmpA family protein [Bacteroides sp.]